MKVFLSYSRRDDVVATEVRRRLEAHGHEIWHDVSSIAGGADWRASIEQGIRAADTFLLILEAQQRELGRKALRVGSVVAAVAATGAAAAVNAKAAERKSADKRLTAAQQAAQQDYRNRVAGLIASFSQEFSRADEAISPETYQKEFRPRLELRRTTRRNCSTNHRVLRPTQGLRQKSSGIFRESRRCIQPAETR